MRHPSLPPLDVQREIVTELDSYRKIVEGAKQVIANYKPTIKIDPTWPRVLLDKIAEFEYGFTTKATDGGNTRYIRITDIGEDGHLRDNNPVFIDLNAESKPYLLRTGDLLVARIGATFGKSLLYTMTEQSIFASYLIRVRVASDKLVSGYAWVFMQSDDYWSQARSLVQGGGQPQFNANVIRQVQLPLPPVEEQKRIVEEFIAERALVDANRKLVEIFEKKIQDKLAEIWGEGE